MTFKKVALIGAGAVGAYFIYGFTNLKDIEFCVVADGERGERLKRDGVVINDTLYRPDVKTPAEAHGADVLFICTKYHGLPSALAAIEAVCDDHTTVISLLNGIDSEEIIGNRIGHEHMLYSVMRIPSQRKNGKTTFIPENVVGVAIGEKGSKEVTPRLEAFAKLMEKANLHYQLKENILLNQWEKYSMNIIHNLPQAVLNVGFGAYYDSEYVGRMKNRLYDEVCLVAKAEGITLGEQGDWRSVCANTARFSTLQDLDAKRHTEIDMFLGVLMKLAEKHGLSVPFSEFTYCAIKAIEEKNDGKFDY